MPNTFRRKNRLSHSKRFQQIFREGKSFQEGTVRVYIHANDTSYSRVGVIVPKKVILLSTERHQLKRIIREYFRLHQLTGYDLIILLRKREHSIAQIRSTLDALWNQIRIWKCAII